jgi:hypothetical protein
MLTVSESESGIRARDRVKVKANAHPNSNTAPLLLSPLSDSDSPNHRPHSETPNAPIRHDRLGLSGMNGIAALRLLPFVRLRLCLSGLCDWCGLSICLDVLLSTPVPPTAIKLADGSVSSVRAGLPIASNLRARLSVGYQLQVRSYRIHFCA